MGLADFRNHGRRLDGRAGRCVELLVVVQLDDLDIRHVLGCLARHDHQEHGADGEVRRDEGRRIILFSCLGNLCLLLVREARRADDRRGLVRKRRHDIAEDDVRAREVDHDLWLLAREQCLEVCLDEDAVCRQADERARIRTALDVHCADELEPVRFLYRF